MTRRRRFTDEECRALASWFTQLRAMGSVRGKARELGISVPALYDAIARGDGRLPAATRHKLSSAELEDLVELIHSRCS